MHHVLLGSRFDVLVTHCLDSLLFSAELVLKDLQLDSILSMLLLFIFKSTSQLPHFVFDSILVCLEEPNFLRVKLVIFSLFLNSLGSSIKDLPLHVKSLDLLLQLVVLVHHLRKLFFELSLLLLKRMLFDDQISAAIFRVLQLFTQL